jgi:hypothetical protein
LLVLSYQSKQVSILHASSSPAIPNASTISPEPNTLI